MQSNCSKISKIVKISALFTLFTLFFTINTNSQELLDSVAFRLAGYGYQQMELIDPTFDDTLIIFMFSDSLPFDSSLLVEPGDWRQVSYNSWVSYGLAIETIDSSYSEGWFVDTTDVIDTVAGNQILHRTIDSIHRYSNIYGRKLKHYVVVYILPELWIQPEWSTQ